MYSLIDHRELKGSAERIKYFKTLEEVKSWLGEDFLWCESIDDINDQLREEAQGDAYYELEEPWTPKTSIIAVLSATRVERRQKMNINEKFSELAQYKRIQEETAAIIDSLQDEIKAYMTENNIDTLASDEHKAIYKDQIRHTVDTTALKKDLPDVAERYSITRSFKFFKFA